MKDRITLR